MSSSHLGLAIQILVAQTLNANRKTERLIACVQATTSVTRTVLVDLNVYWTRIALAIRAAHATSV